MAKLSYIQTWTIYEVSNPGDLDINGNKKYRMFIPLKYGINQEHFYGILLTKYNDHLKNHHHFKIGDIKHNGVENVILKNNIINNVFYKNIKQVSQDKITKDKVKISSIELKNKIISEFKLNANTKSTIYKFQNYKKMLHEQRLTINKLKNQNNDKKLNKNIEQTQNYY